MKRRIVKNLSGASMSCSFQNSSKIRELLVDQFYVIKEIDTSKMPKEIALEQLMEIELLGELESPFIVGYFDSFIENTKINIIMEYC